MQPWILEEDITEEDESIVIDWYLNSSFYIMKKRSFEIEFLCGKFFDNFVSPLLEQALPSNKAHLENIKSCTLQGLNHWWTFSSHQRRLYSRRFFMKSVSSETATSSVYQLTFALYLKICKPLVDSWYTYVQRGLKTVEWFLKSIKYLQIRIIMCMLIFSTTSFYKSSLLLYLFGRDRVSY